MTLKAFFCTGMGLLGLLGSVGIAGAGETARKIKSEDALELFVSCESNYPLLSVRWGGGDNEKAAETASAFLDVPSVTPKMILDKAGECFSALKSEQGMIAVDFNRVELRCGVGPDIARGRIVVLHIN